MWTAKLGDAELTDRGYGKAGENAGEGEHLGGGRENVAREAHCWCSRTTVPRDVHEEAVLRRWIEDMMSNIRIRRRVHRYMTYLLTTLNTHHTPIANSYTPIGVLGLGVLGLGT